jgi:Uma2 family endonuclease
MFQNIDFIQLFLLILDNQLLTCGVPDRLQKMRIYQRAQIEHYWLLDPQAKSLECFALHDCLYALVASGMDEEVVEHPDFTGLSIPLKSLWSK